MIKDANKNLALNLLRCIDSPVIFLSSDHFILDINQSALELYGWRRENSVEKHFSTLLKEHKFKNPLPKKFPSHKQREDSISDVLTTIKKKKEEITVSWKINSIVDENNVFQGIILLGHDITQQRKLEDKIYELDSVIAQMPNNVYWYNKKLEYLGCNENSAKTLGMSRQEAIGKNFVALMKKVRGIDETSTNQWIQDGLDVMYTGVAKLNISEDPFVGPNNEMIYTLTNKVPLFDKKGKLYGVVGISTDITKQREIEQDLQKAKEKAEASNRAKTDFLSNMSHDVKTPLSGIISCYEGYAH